jgi:Protein of unknown function (DUF4229)
LTGGVNIPPALTYSVARIAIFAVTLLFLLLALPRLNLLLVAAIAALVSGVLSYYLLAGPRERMARSVARRVRGAQERLDRKAAAEDSPEDAPEDFAGGGTDDRDGRGGRPDSGGGPGAGAEHDAGSADRGAALRAAAEHDAGGGAGGGRPGSPAEYDVSGGAGGDRPGGTPEVGRPDGAPDGSESRSS